MDIRGKTFVVTGGGSGMGRELTLLLLKKGARVAALDINETTLKETAALAGDVQGRLSLHVLNIADREAVAAFPEAVIQAHGAVDAIINNAGIIQRFVLVNDLEYKDIERVVNVNFWGVVNVTKTFLPYLLQRPEAYIVNTSSMGGYLAGSRSNRVWRNQSRGEIIYRRVTFRIERHPCPCNNGFSRSNRHQHFRQLRSEYGSSGADRKYAENSNHFSRGCSRDYCSRHREKSISCLYR